MPVSEKVKSFRYERASELDQFARVLKKLGNCDPYPLNVAADQLRNLEFVPKVDKNDEVNYNYWGYATPDLVFYFEDVPPHTYPENPTNLTLSLSVKHIADFTAFKLLQDPYIHLEVNVVVRGTYTKELKSIELITSYHLDRHIEKSGDNSPEYVHPIYHFQFGGRKLDKKFKDFGSFLILDSPRIVHYPMDIVLSVDFVLSNFFPSQWKDLRKDGEYVNILREYQELFWKPYAHSKALNWRPYDEGLVNWQPGSIWPQLIIGK